MSTKRQPSKQRRQTQNQRQRAALETRRANAAAGGVADAKVEKSERSSTPSDGGGGSVFSRLRGASTTGRAIRTSGAGRTEPPGYRAAMSGLLAAVAAAVAGALFIPVAVDASGEQISSRGALVGEWTLSAYDVVQENPDATADEVADQVEDWMPNDTEPYGKAAFPLSLGLVLPVVGAGLAFRAVSRRSPAKVVNRTMYVTLFGTLLTGQLVFIFLPTVIGVGIAAFQVRKAELRAAAEAAAAADGEGPDGEDDDVIDVDEVIDAEEAVEGDQLIEADDAAADLDEGADDDQRKV
jgi:hypothetical protein